MNRFDDAGKSILRLTVGLLMLSHGLHKLINGIDGISALIATNGWPSVLAYGVYIGEIVAPVLIILGVLTRPAALIVVVNMILAIYLAHSHQLFQLTKTGGWFLELQAFFLFGALCVALLGAGKFSLAGSRGRFN
jgi:putative oxidoreductase